MFQLRWYLFDNWCMFSFLSRTETVQDSGVSFPNRSRYTQPTTGNSGKLIVGEWICWPLLKAAHSYFILGPFFTCCV